ncbi:Phosphomethylpyrimidine kinase-domain-containing protein [Mycena maculata]|uniref:Phosphomethylpyrimidine kinase-domain-containing protein n=1 Tax=Mycena maculata TaxID=230809 RepID=A0AAD7NX45_9AGAR|nr:Phosphomethylpyrimidine kinase-domain-containing protein [Mycena maculata]
MRTILSIAGSDSSGGAGIQADLKTFAALGHYGTSVVTALTAQNTIGVQGIHGVPPQFIEQQIHSVLNDLDVHAIKTGMLFDAENTRATIRALKDHYCGDRVMPPLVCDPVCVSTSGHTLLAPDAVQVLIQDLFPLTTLITPNKSESELLLSRAINSLEDMLSAASDLLRLGPRAVLLKGGHMTATLADLDSLARAHPEVRMLRDGLYGDNMEILAINGPQPGELVVDVLCEADGSMTVLARPRIDSSSTHGTGCTLSAALASALAGGSTLSDAVISATAYTHLGIETAPKIGAGHGPLNHLHSVTQMGIPPRTPGNPYPFTRLLISGSAAIWKEYVEHGFVQQLGKGTLSQTSFVHFIKQDYHYLKYYARAYSLLAAKSASFARIDAATQTIGHILREITTHRAFCAEFGVSADELEATAESSATTAYGCYLMDVGIQGDATKLLMALLACLLGYGEVGLWLKSAAERAGSGVALAGNPYRRWIEDYSGAEYQAAVRAGLETIEAVAAADPPSPARLSEWRAVWERCTRLEKAFWDAALDDQVFHFPKYTRGCL